jgi:hypothetical protein
MVQGRFKALSISVFAHVALLYTIAETTTFKPTAKSQKPPVINSYIYQPKPKKLAQPAPSVKEATKQEKKPVITVNDAKILTNSSKKNTSSPAPKQPGPLDDISPQKKQLNRKSKALSAKSIRRNALAGIAKINELKDKQFVEQQTNEMFKHRSPSVLDGEPLPVPRSNQQFTPDQIREKSTTRYSDDLSIIKGDNGRCSIEEDLSKIGIEGVTAVSGFNCGESKFDASFRQHMEKVRKKIGK